MCNIKGRGYCYRAVPVGCLQKPYELKECPRDIADLDWPESKKLKENQDLMDWTSEINSADWTICHVRIAHRIPIVICDYLIQGTTLLDYKCPVSISSFATIGGEPCLLFVSQIKPSCPSNLDEAVITNNKCYSLSLDT